MEKARTTFCCVKRRLRCTAEDPVELHVRCKFARAARPLARRAPARTAGSTRTDCNRVVARLQLRWCPQRLRRVDVRGASVSGFPGGAVDLRVHSHARVAAKRKRRFPATP